MTKKQIIQENIIEIITIIIPYTIMFGLVIFATMAVQPMHPNQNHQLIQENLQLAKQYHQLTVKHQNLNRQYLETHGYQESVTTTDGNLLIVPYGSKSNTKISIHTPAMVKLEYQQQPIKKQFKHNNAKLTNNRSKTVNLKTQTIKPNNRVIFANILLIPVWILTISLGIMSANKIISDIKAISKAKKG